MVQINFAQKSVNLKVVYYGPGMSGKTTNLEVIHQRAPEGNRGDLTSISTDGDRTLFFDYMPLDLGTVAGMRTAFQLYTVPGQVYYNSTRKLVLQGVDGVIFIADSSAAMMNQNIESLRNLEENLNEYGKSLATLPHVIQFNKRDLPDAMSVEELSRMLNPHNVPVFEAIANTGQGVFPTLKALAASVLKNIMNESGQKNSYPAPAAPAPAQQQRQAPQRQQPAQCPAAPFQPQVQNPGPFPGQMTGPGMGVPAYPNMGAPQQVAGGGFFAGGPMQNPMQGVPMAQPMMGQPMMAQPMVQQPMQAPQQGGLQLAPPQHLRQPPRPGLNVADPHARPAAAQARPARPAAQAPAPAAKPRAAQKPQPQPEPQKRARGKFTPVFIVVGAGVGAVLAWVLMNVL